MDAIFDHLTMYGLGLKVVTVERNHLLAWGYSLRYTSAFVKAGALAVNIMSYLYVNGANQSHGMPSYLS